MFYIIIGFLFCLTRNKYVWSKKKRITIAGRILLIIICTYTQTNTTMNKRDRHKIQQRLLGRRLIHCVVQKNETIYSFVNDYHN